MKNLFITIIGMILIFPSISNAGQEAELIWRTERLGGNGSIPDVELSNTRNVFFNVLDNIVQVRNILDGVVIDTITFNNYFNNINGISNTDDDRYMAVSGDKPYLIIWDMVNKQIFKKFTKIVYDGDTAHTWKSASISPDGTKLTAIAIIEPAGATELVVFDLVTEDVLLSGLRNIYDKINEVYYGPQWVSTEFSPNGEYLVTELSVNWAHQSGQVLLDSVYVYKTSDYKVNNTFLNNFDEKDIAFSSYENVISSNHGNTLRIYNLDTKESKSKTFNSYITGVAFSRQSKKIIHKIGQGKPYIFDYNLMDTIFSYSAYCLASKVTKDNKYIISNANGALSLVHANWDGVTGVSQNEYGINFSISPNPTTNTININLNSNGFEFIRLSIVDILGNEVGLIEEGLMNTFNYQKEYDVSNLPASTYFIRLEIGNEVVTRQFIKE